MIDDAKEKLGRGRSIRKKSPFGHSRLARRRRRRRSGSSSPRLLPPPVLGPRGQLPGLPRGPLLGAPRLQPRRALGARVAGRVLEAELVPAVGEPGAQGPGPAALVLVRELLPPLSLASGGGRRDARGGVRRGPCGALPLPALVEPPVPAFPSPGVAPQLLRVLPGFLLDAAPGADGGVVPLLGVDDGVQRGEDGGGGGLRGLELGEGAGDCLLGLRKVFCLVMFLKKP